MTTDCNFQNSMNEKEINFQYLEHLEVEIMNSKFKLKDSIFSVGENSEEKSSSYEENKSSKGLILKEFPEHFSCHFSWIS